MQMEMPQLGAGFSVIGFTVVLLSFAYAARCFSNRTARRDRHEQHERVPTIDMDMETDLDFGNMEEEDEGGLTFHEVQAGPATASADLDSVTRI